LRTLDNINDLFGDDLKGRIKKGSKLQIAASCFSIYAYEALKKELEKIDALEFIFTAPTFVPNEQSDKIRKERREFTIPKRDRERGLYGTEFEIRLKNQLTQKAIAKECADWIRRKARFKSNTTPAPMQQFACIPGSEATAYMPIQGFTAVDLGYEQGNAVSNMVNCLDEPTMAKTFLDLFENIWRDPTKLQDVTEQLCNHIENIYQENAPNKVYFLILYNIFNEFLEDLSEDVLPNDLTGYQDSVVWNTLYNFQKDAAVGLINKLETYNGCILADSVGLGKTFTALGVIKYYELRNKAVLVLCPKKLAGNWQTYNSNLKTNILAKDRLNYDILCHTDLSRTSGESLGLPLNQVNWGNYDLVVIDESHNFRNNEALKEKETRYQKLMRMVIREGVKTKVLMLSATPVNNRFTDLRNQLALAYEGESSTLSKKLGTERPIEDIFKRAQAVFNDWSKLPTEERTAELILERLDFDFFKLLDSVTIARSRKHITTYYDTADIGDFPNRRKPVSHRCKLTSRADVMSFNEIYLDLSQVKMSVYAPISYVLPSRLKKYEEMYDTEVREGKGRLTQMDREKALQSLMTVNLLKRLESSVHAFRLTLEKLNNFYLSTLEKIAAYEATGKMESIDNIIKDFDPDDDELPTPEEQLIGGKIKIDLADIDLPSWKHELQGDQQLLSHLLLEMEKVSPEDDFKLQHLIQSVKDKILDPFNLGNKKALIFTAFSDTADYLYKHLSAEVTDQFQLHSACVTGGSSNPKSTLGTSYDFQEVMTLFSPRSKKKDLILENEPREIDVLVGTDCISEGQNLQDCDIVINYDIHWNPVRIIQRFGRVDRIGSTNTDIQLVNYWPDISLDEYINLKDRVESRMVIADVSATGDDNVLSAKANDTEYRKEQLRRLQEEVIELEDLKTGVSITDLGLNDFRMDLVRYIKDHPDIPKLPNGIHTVVPAAPEKGLVPGVIFAMKNIKATTPDIGGHNRLHPFYLVYIGQDGDIIAEHSRAKHLLDLARAACKPYSEPVAKVVEPFNKDTRDGRNMQAYSDLLDRAIRSMIDVKEDKDIDSLFTGERTTALLDSIAGLDDFELLGFVVVYGES